MVIKENACFVCVKFLCCCCCRCWNIFRTNELKKSPILVKYRAFFVYNKPSPPHTHTHLFCVLWTWDPHVKSVQGHIFKIVCVVFIQLTHGLSLYYYLQLQLLNISLKCYCDNPSLVICLLKILLC